MQKKCLGAPGSGSFGIGIEYDNLSIFPSRLVHKPVFGTSDTTAFGIRRALLSFYVYTYDVRISERIPYTGTAVLIPGTY